CRSLAIEGIKTHPFQYALQVWRDMVKMHITSGVRYVAPDNSEPASQFELLQELKMPDPIIHAEQSEAELAAMTVTTASENSAANNPNVNGATTPKKHIKRHAIKGRF